MRVMLWWGSRSHGWEWTARHLAPLSLLAIFVIGAAICASYYSLHSYDRGMQKRALARWQSRVVEQEQHVDRLRRYSNARLAAMVQRMSELHTRLVYVEGEFARLQHLVAASQPEQEGVVVAGLPGAPDPLAGQMLVRMLEDSGADFTQTINHVDDRMARLSQEISVVGQLLLGRELHAQVWPPTRPVRKGHGWQTSSFGMRLDPIVHRVRFHSGIDYGGYMGSEILAAAGGVVTFSGKMGNYGYMVELYHGSGLATRYAHNLHNLVQVGSVVKRGQVVALMGNSGRSTGSHVHFEILQNGEVVDPSLFLARNAARHH